MQGRDEASSPRRARSREGKEATAAAAAAPTTAVTMVVVAMVVVVAAAPSGYGGARVIHVKSTRRRPDARLPSSPPPLFSWASISFLVAVRRVASFRRNAARLAVAQLAGKARGG